MKVPFVWVATMGLACLTQTSLAAQAPSSPPDITTLKLEDLMKIEVTSVSRKQETIFGAAAAIFVITREEILRSGATNIPDLLRRVPGLDVAQINPSTWAISARGFNGQYSNKLLVLMDGRTVYSQLFSGVFWDTQEIPVESIERIEVIRGPGAAVWGANAVNGVINIITKSAKDAQGGSLTAGGGTLERGPGMLRYGGMLGSNVAYRVAADGFEVDPLSTQLGRNGQDDWYLTHGGIRVDADASAKNSIMVEGDVYKGNEGETALVPTSLLPPVNSILALRDRFSGWDLLARWSDAISPRSTTSLQVYFDRGSRGDTTFGVGWNTFDLDFHHQVGWGSRQDIVWGVGYRVNSDGTAPVFRISFNPAKRTTQLFSSFFQDEIKIRPRQIDASLGVKLEHDDYNGFHLQPSARISWIPNDRNMFWASISGAQRTPSRSETAVRFNDAVVPGPNNLPILISFFGNPNQKAERLTSVEAGYRMDLSDRLSLDSTAFFNQYRDLASLEPGALRPETDPLPMHLLLPSSFANLLHGETHGIEVFAGWKLAGRWTLSPGYSFLALHIHGDAASQDLTSAPQVEGGSPLHQAQLRSEVNLPWRWQWTAAAYFVDRLPAQEVPSYTRLDTNLTWQMTEKSSLSLGGDNLLRDRHMESANPATTVQPNLVKRYAFARIAWRF